MSNICLNGNGFLAISCRVFTSKIGIAISVAVEGCFITIGIFALTHSLPGVGAICASAATGLGIFLLSMTTGLCFYSRCRKIENKEGADVSSEEVVEYIKLDDPLSVVGGHARYVSGFKPKHGSLNTTAPKIATSFCAEYQLPCIRQYEGDKGMTYAELAIRLPNSSLKNFPEWIQRNSPSPDPELYFLVYNERSKLSIETRNLSLHFMVFPSFNHNRTQREETQVEVSLSEPDGIEATEDIPQDAFNSQQVIINTLEHTSGIEFAPNALKFNLLDQEICQGFFTTSFFDKTAIFHIVIVRSADFTSDNVSAVTQAIMNSNTVQEFIEAIAQSDSPQKDKILRTFIT